MRDEHQSVPDGPLHAANWLIRNFHAYYEAQKGGAAGLIMRHGYIVAEWGDPARVDMTHSVTKTFLTTVIGLAWQRGLIRDVSDYAREFHCRAKPE